jgi:hypothetical protein
MIHKIARRVHRFLYPPQLPEAARTERWKDHAGLTEHDPGLARTIQEGIGWMYRAQDESRTRDGGVARHYSLIDGWSNSYPETTGYIIPTILTYGRSRGGEAAEEARRRARRMLDWLVGIQFPEGGFQGGMIGQTPVVPVTFNTGQILLGLAAGVEEFGDAYVKPMTRAADWLVAMQDPDGCWRRFPTPFAEPGEKAYETHVAWGLIEADRVSPNPRYREAALANIRWALGWQTDNGWLDRCCLDDPSTPLTHTIGYALRGILEGYRATHDPALLASARRTADGALSSLRPDGFLPGRIGPKWRGAVRWACLTGSAQIAYCWLMLYQDTGDPRYRAAAFAANRYVRRTVAVDGPPGTQGGVKGSFPVDGAYGAFAYLNWACKFCLDSQMLESAVRDAPGGS